MSTSSLVQRLSLAALAAGGRACGLKVVRVGCCGILLAGCATRPRPATAPAPLPPLTPAGVVARVNAEHGFAVLECHVVPKPGDEMVVWRHGRRVAVVRVREERQGCYVAADILAGVPLKGDGVRSERVEPLAAGEGER